MKFTAAATALVASVALAAPSAEKRSTSVFFSPYKDVTINANWNTNVISTDVTGTQESVLSALGNTPALTWAFATGECGTETWGGLNAQDFATANVNAWNSAGKKYILSTGGAAGVFTCGTDAGFTTFLERYWSNSLVGVDFDIELGQTQAQIAALVARVQTAQKNSKYANLRFSFTVATLGAAGQQDLGATGELVMQVIKSAGLKNYFINLMAMDYGSGSSSVCTLGSNGQCEMGQSAVNAAKSLNQFYGVPYSQIELTPMIGGNDSADETFTIADVTTVTNFAKSVGLGGVHFWSFDRDVDCVQSWSSPTCNSYGQGGTLGFTKAFTNAL